MQINNEIEDTSLDFVMVRFWGDTQKRYNELNLL